MARLVARAKGGRPARHGLEHCPPDHVRKIAPTTARPPKQAEVPCRTVFVPVAMASRRELILGSSAVSARNDAGYRASARDHGEPFAQFPRCSFEPVQQSFRGLLSGPGARVARLDDIDTHRTPLSRCRRREGVWLHDPET